MWARRPVTVPVRLQAVGLSKQLRGVDAVKLQESLWTITYGVTICTSPVRQWTHTAVTASRGCT